MANTIFAPLPPAKSAGRFLPSLLLHGALVGILLLPLWRPVRQVVQTAVLDRIFVPELPTAPRFIETRALASMAPAPVAMPAILDATPEPATAPNTLVPMAAVLLPNGMWTSLDAVPGPAAVGTSSGMGTTGIGSGTPGGLGTTDGCPVSNPVAIVQPDPEYSDAARAAKLSGIVMVSLTIAADGSVQAPSVVQGLGLGLDEKALAAVKQWRFRPATACGHALAIGVQVEVHFQLY